MTGEIGQVGGWGQERLHALKPQKEESPSRCERKNERPPAGEAVDHVTGALGHGWGCGKGAACEGAMSMTVVSWQQQEATAHYRTKEILFTYSSKCCYCQSYVTAGGQSASLSWCRAPPGLMTRFIMF